MKKIFGVAMVFFAGITATFARVIFDNAPGHAVEEGKVLLARGGEPGIAWRLVDWLGGDTGIAGKFTSDGSTSLPPLKAGYYRLEMAADEPPPNRLLASIAVVEHLDAEALRPQTPFAIDTALSWIARPGSFFCPWNGGDTFTTIADLIQLCGFRHVRERLKWGGVQPVAESSPDWGRYMTNATLFKDRGIGVSGMFHDAPAWAGSAGSESLPSDLGALYAFCSNAVVAFGNRMDDWEFWNEEDIHFAKEPVWEYVAAMKAAYLGIKAACPQMPVLNGALCQKPWSSKYNDIFFENDASRYFDVFNYHTYVRLSNYPALFSALRDQIQRGGAGNKPIWITEFGTNAEGNSSSEGVKKGMMAHSPAQELVHAEVYSKSLIALMMEGIERAYFFVFPPFNERRGYKDWGVMRRDGTVKPIFSAMATAIRVLDGAKLCGKLDAPEEIRAYLFKKSNGMQTIAFWSESPLDTEISGEVAPAPDFTKEWILHLPEANVDESYRLVDMCGVVSSVNRDKTDGSLVLRATRFPSYVSNIQGLVAKIPPFAKEHTDKNDNGDSAANADLAIVLRPSLNQEDFVLSDGKSLAVLKGNIGHFTLDVWNFANSEKSGIITATGAIVTGLPDEPFMIAPFSCRTFSCSLSPASDATYAKLVLGGTFDNRTITRAVIPLFFEESFLSKCERHPIDWRNPARWIQNTCADEEHISLDDSENAIRIDSSWNNIGDHWTYPVMKLNLPHESLAGAKRISFEVKSIQDKVENDFKTAKFMIMAEDGKPDIYLDYTPPTVDWELRFVDIPDGFDFSNAQNIRIGANPLGSRCTIWFRNLEILK